jgi:hypothetical protein
VPSKGHIHAHFREMENERFIVIKCWNCRVRMYNTLARIRDVRAMHESLHFRAKNTYFAWWRVGRDLIRIIDKKRGTMHVRIMCLMDILLRGFRICIERSRGMRSGGVGCTAAAVVVYGVRDVWFISHLFVIMVMVLRKWPSRLFRTALCTHNG